MDITHIPDDDLMQLLTHSRVYSLVILKDGPQRHIDGVEAIIWEHGRRNAGLRHDGVLSIVCPVPDDSDVDGVGIFNLTIEEARAVMDGDPGVIAGVFTYEVHPCGGFPGDQLPA